MKKLIIFLVTLTFLISLYAVDFPSYDFTFYSTSDETLTSLTKDNVGIDVTGYGFIGKEARNGIYLRIGIQTPFDTLLKLKDELFSPSGEKQKGGSGTDDTDTTSSNPALTTSTTTLTTDSPVTTETADESYSSTDEGTTTILPGDTTIAVDEKTITKDTTLDTTKWKFLFSLGPAYRSPMGENAMVYAGVGFCFSTEFLNTFNSESKYYNSSFSSMFSLDLDAGFRVGLIYSKTTIRIGVHAITHLLGYSQMRQYLKDDKNPMTTRSFYCYFAGEKGLVSATVLRGYVRLATTFREKTKTVYNYSNTSPVVGKGTIRIVDGN